VSVYHSESGLKKMLVNQSGNKWQGLVTLISTDTTWQLKQCVHLWHTLF